jgi:hypothetical protein
MSRSCFATARPSSPPLAAGPLARLIEAARRDLHGILPQTDVNEHNSIYGRYVGLVYKPAPARSAPIR